MKLLQNMSLLQRFPLYVGSKFVTAQTHFSFYCRNFIRAVQQKNMSIAFQEEREKQIKTLYDFQKPYFFYNWVITNDKEIGGESEGKAYFDEDHLYVKGNLVEERSDLLVQRMYYGISSKFFSRLNLSEYNGIRLTVKTDGNLYKLLMRISSFHENDHYAYAFVVDNSKEWQTLEVNSKLPFDLFLREKESMYEKATLISGNLGKFILRSIGLVIENEKGVDFDFAIKRIEVVYNPEFEELTKIYQRPFFFYAQDSYKNITQLNTGKELLSLQRSTHQQERTTINNVFSEAQVTGSTPKSYQRHTKTPEQTKPAFSIKDKLSKKAPK